MTSADRKAIVKLGMCIDLVVYGVSLLLASAALNLPIWSDNLLLVRQPLHILLTTIVLGFSWHISLDASGSYNSYRIAGWRNQASALLTGSTLTTTWTFVWFCLFRLIYTIPAKSIFIATLTFWVFTLSGLLITRMIGRCALNILRWQGRNLRNVLIIGSNHRAVALADNLLAHNSFGYRVLGFVDDFWHFNGAPDSYKEMLLGQSVDIPELLRNLAVDEVILALPIASTYRLSHQIIDLCRQQGILVHYESSHLFDIQSPALPVAEASLQLVTISSYKPNAWGVAGKRLIDLIFSAFALLLALPLIILIALAIKLTAPGPIFYAQERLGLSKHRFKIFKFRTMVQNAEALISGLEHLNQSQGPTFKLTNDPRITVIGSFLRKTSLDELPQLFNVLLGDMSLVGPRPLPLRDYRGFTSDWHRRRFSVKPGITCLWQVSGRSSIGFEQWMEMDMDYIDRWSLWLDLKILFQTIPAVVRGSGAM
jgi:exopolysaccharide biosynthesis polyprenyl glycosylphosphotransferase